MRILTTRLQRSSSQRRNQLALHPPNHLPLFTRLPKLQIQHFSNQRNPESLMTRSPRPIVMVATTWLVRHLVLQAMLLEAQELLERGMIARKRTGSRSMYNFVFGYRCSAVLEFIRRRRSEALLFDSAAMSTIRVDNMKQHGYSPLTPFQCNERCITSRIISFSS